MCEKFSNSLSLEEEFNFLKEGFLKVGEYFKNGGEIYSQNELITKIENDFGYMEKDIILLLDECEKRGFITPVGNNVYTK